ncbi:chorismate mutase [Amycolatopsis sp.]|uniref:chorismate mutase n=1 Tax=Amycolatopsis sp. TaxID=37632 RepID=UPI002DF7E187|nr:chorismate mutase [Amycolatopsis sp.]
MRLRSSILCALVVFSAAVLCVTPASASPRESLRTLTGLSAERVQLADKVAAAKFGTPSPIDDPVREQQIFDTVSAEAPALGLDPAATVAVFRDQIEANKLVQRALYARWTAHPDEQPTTRPDLATEVRPQLDRITTGLLDQLAATRGTRGSRTCEPRLAVTVHVVDWRFDRLHRKALTEAVRSVCD